MEDQTLTDIGNAALSTIFDGAWEPVSYDDAGASSDGDTSAAPVDTGQPRGADGRFVPKQEQEQQEEVGEETSGEEESGEPEVESEETPDAEGDGLETDADGEEEAYVLELDDPELLDLLNTKYGGDVGKALQGLKEAQSLIGRQGSELGELRELRQQIESLQELMSLQQQAASIDWDEVISEDPQQAVLLAAQYQNMAAFEQAITAWAAVEPIQAFTFLQSVQNEAAAPPPTTLESEVDALKAKYPDLQQRLPAIEETAAKRPALAGLLQSEDPRVRAQALEDLYHLSGGASTADTSTAARKIILRAKAEEDAAKADASVVSASNNAPPPEPPPSGDDALVETLQQYLGLGDDFKIVG